MLLSAPQLIILTLFSLAEEQKIIKLQDNVSQFYSVGLKKIQAAKWKRDLKEGDENED